MQELDLTPVSQFMEHVNIRQVQEYLGHKSLETTMIYTHVVRELSLKARSPLDLLENRGSGALS